jgi:hypothetical protein
MIKDKRVEKALSWQQKRAPKARPRNQKIPLKALPRNQLRLQKRLQTDSYLPKRRWMGKEIKGTLNDREEWANFLSGTELRHAPPLEANVREEETLKRELAHDNFQLAPIFSC